MNHQERIDMIEDWIKTIDFMRNYKYHIQFIDNKPCIRFGAIHKRHIRKLNKVLKNMNMSHILVIADEVVKSGATNKNNSKAR